MRNVRREAAMENLLIIFLCATIVVLLESGANGQGIPTTLQGPFTPRTVTFDPSLRQGSPDLLPTDPRVVKNVTGNYPEQISLALSTPDAMWITWITGVCVFRTLFPYLEDIAQEVFYGERGRKRERELCNIPILPSAKIIVLRMRNGLISVSQFSHPLLKLPKLHRRSKCRFQYRLLWRVWR